VVNIRRSSDFLIGDHAVSAKVSNVNINIDDKRMVHSTATAQRVTHSFGNTSIALASA
jgi:hypothetical protein